MIKVPTSVGQEVRIRYSVGAFGILVLASCGAATEDPGSASLISASALTVQGGVAAVSAKAGQAGQSASIPSITNLPYNSGTVISNVKVAAVFWGATVDSTVTSDIGGFYGALTNNPWIDMLSEYSTYVSGGSNQFIGRGSLLGTFQITPRISGNSVTDAQIQTELQNQINAQVLPQPDANTVYMINFPPGVVINRNGSTSCSGFCAYHDRFSLNGTRVTYGVIPDFGTGSGCDTGCGSGTMFQNISYAASHELGEAITDPNYDAWETGNAAVESGDPCNQQEVPLPGTSYTVQQMFSNRVAQCIQFYNGPTYQALDLSNILVEGQDGKLWFEQGPFGSIPPTREQVDDSVLTFQALDSSNIVVLGSDGNLWFEFAPFGTVPPSREQVDGAVSSFQALDASDILVLGNDHKLWFEYAPFGTPPPSRAQVDAAVLSFQAIDSQHVLALGTDGKLWMEQAPFGSVPPTRQQVDGDVRLYGAIDTNNVVVLGTDNTLWLEQAPFGSPPPTRQQIDAGVRTFQPIDASNVFVLGTDGNLWLEHAPFGNPPPSRQQVDGSVSTFRAIDSQHVLLLGRDGNLWLETAPFGIYYRQQVDATVQF